MEAEVLPISLIILLGVTHVLSDALFQSREMAEKKSSHVGYLFTHVVIIYICFLLALSMYGIDTNRASLFSLSNSLIHFIIDATTWNVYKWFVYLRFPKVDHTYEYWKDKHFYTTIVLDQTLHIVTLMILGRTL